MVRQVLRSSACLWTAPAILCAIYALGLPDRTDYLGHFLAGCGATLAAVGVLLALVPSGDFNRLAPPLTLAMVCACIGAGAVTEATVFRLAKWDEVDFCSQSLGAVLAGLGALAAWREGKPNDALLWAAFAGAVVCLAGGFHFALE